MAEEVKEEMEGNRDMGGRDFRCYWVDDCFQQCRDDEYVAAESKQMMCSGGRSCKGRVSRTNKFCCPIPRHLFRQNKVGQTLPNYPAGQPLPNYNVAQSTPNFQADQSPITPIASLACAFGLITGGLCPNQQQQPGLIEQQPGNIQPVQNFDFDCRWTDECRRSCRVGEFSAAETRRLAMTQHGNTQYGNERFCREQEGLYHYCCKGPRIIWTSSQGEYRW